MNNLKADILSTRGSHFKFIAVVCMNAHFVDLSPDSTEMLQIILIYECTMNSPQLPNIAS